MSAAGKYGRSLESLSAESLSQARSAGQTLADKGTVQQATLGSGAPAPTPAAKYGAPVESNAMGKSLAHESQGRSR